MSGLANLSSYPSSSSNSSSYRLQQFSVVMQISIHFLELESPDVLTPVFRNCPTFPWWFPVHSELLSEPSPGFSAQPSSKVALCFCSSSCVPRKAFPWQACFLPSSYVIQRDSIDAVLFGRLFELQLFFPTVINGIQSCWGVGMPCVRMGMINTGPLGVALSRAGQRVLTSAEGRVHLQFGYCSNGEQLQNNYIDKPFRDFWWVQMYFSRVVSKTCKLCLLKLKDNPWVHDNVKEATG